MMAVAGDVGDHEAAIELPQRLVLEAPSLPGARLRAFQQQVGVAREPQHDVAAARLGHVERDREHVTPFLDPVGPDRRAAVARGQLVAEAAPGRVANSRLLDVNHLGAHLGGEFGRERLGDKIAGGDYPHSLERSEVLWKQPVARHRCHFSTFIGLGVISRGKCTPRRARLASSAWRERRLVARRTACGINPSPEVRTDGTHPPAAGQLRRARIV